MLPTSCLHGAINGVEGRLIIPYMNKRTFLNKVECVTKHASRFLSNVDKRRVFQVVQAAATKDPTLLVESFSKFYFGYTKEMFDDPKVKGNENRKEAIEMMTKPGTFRVRPQVFQDALRLTSKQLGWSNSPLRPVSHVIAAQTLPTETSSGFPQFIRPKGSLVPQLIYDVGQLLLSGRFDIITDACLVVVYWRTQTRATGIKYRQIFVMPHYFNCLENMFAHSIFQFYKINRNTCYSFDANWKDNAKVWSHLQNFNETLSLDYSKFDFTVSQELLKVGFTIIRSAFVLSESESKILSAIELAHFSALTVSSIDGKPLIFQKRGGVFSGSVFTNIIDSIINLFMVNCILLELGLDPDTMFIKVKGDDTLIGNNVGLTILEFTDSAKYMFGANISTTASEIFQRGEPIFYLGYLITDRNKLSRNEETLHRKIAFSSRWISPLVMNEPTRVISKLISVLGNVSNGKEIFERVYKQRFLDYYGFSAVPEYYFDLSETQLHPYTTQDARPVWLDLESGWQYK